MKITAKKTKRLMIATVGNILVISNFLPAYSQAMNPASTSNQGETKNTSQVQAGDSSLQLRPAINSVDERTPNVSATTENASQAIDNDFSKHSNAALTLSKKQPPKNTAALNVGSAASRTAVSSSTAILTDAAGRSSGPSTVSNNQDNLDDIQLKAPALQSLVSINSYLNPLRLDASSARTINLRQALGKGLDQNLDLAIVRTNTMQKQYSYYSALGSFLPDPTFGYTDLIPDGRIGLPSGFAGAFASGVSAVNTAGAGASPGAGAAASKDITIRIHSPFELMHAGIDFYAYRGGSILFGAQQSKHNYNAAKYQEKASLSDTLMTITQAYYNLVLAETLLQIRIQAVRTSEEQLRRNSDRFHAGLATYLDVLQSQTQLSSDKQSLIDQQINRRSAAIALADSLYENQGEDFNPPEMVIKKVRLIDPRLNISDILQLAIDHRPELKQFEELRLAAKKAILVSAANLQPTVLLSGSSYGIGPPSNIQALSVFALNINWKLKGFGTVDAFNVEAARWQARQSNLQALKELQSVLSQVRNSYLQILDRERNIEETTRQVESSLEELRLAELRKSHGLGLNLDIISGQKDYTQALVAKAQALINFNIAQAQLLHDIGLISVDGLTSGRLLSKTNLK